MNITIEPTPNKLRITLEGEPSTVREWRGITDGGTHVVLYIAAVAPTDQSDYGVWKLEQELPSYFDPERIAQIP